jgi:hypothetical protein
MKQVSILSLFLILFFTACKKEKDEISLLGKWTIENTVLKEYLNGALSNTNTEPGDGATLDFQNTGYLVVKHPDNSVESVDYTIQPDSKVIIDGDIFEVRNLAAATVTLFVRQD